MFSWSTLDQKKPRESCHRPSTGESLSSIAISWSTISRPTSVAVPMGFGFDRCCAAHVIVHRVGWESLSALLVVCLSLSPGLCGQGRIMFCRRVGSTPGVDLVPTVTVPMGFTRVGTLVSSSTGWESLSALSVVCLSLSPGLSWAGTHRVLPESRSHSRGRPSAKDSRSAEGFGFDRGNTVPMGFGFDAALVYGLVC